MSEHRATPIEKRDASSRLAGLSGWALSWNFPAWAHVFAALMTASRGNWEAAWFAGVAAYIFFSRPNTSVSYGVSPLAPRTVSHIPLEEGNE